MKRIFFLIFPFILNCCTNQQVEKVNTAGNVDVNKVISKIDTNKSPLIRLTQDIIGKGNKEEKKIKEKKINETKTVAKFDKNSAQEPKTEKLKIFVGKDP